jgi:hypothetical protein
MVFHIEYVLFLMNECSFVLAVLYISTRRR